MSDLTASELSVQGTQRPRLTAVNCRVRPGELHVLIGANGAGKSTLLASLAGLQPLDGGRVQLNGHDLKHYPPAELARRRAVLPQSNPLAFDYRVGALIDLGRHPHPQETHTAKHRAIQALDLSRLLPRRVHTLSGGERQRAQLARVLAQLVPAPGSFLFLDEPLAALDLRYRSRLLTLLEELAGDGVGIVISVHELDALHDLDATIHLLHAGAVLAAAPTLEGLGAQALSQAYGGAVHFQQRQMVVIRGD